jgi:hypothetical protein
MTRPQTKSGNDTSEKIPRWDDVCDVIYILHYIPSLFNRTNNRPQPEGGWLGGYSETMIYPVPLSLIYNIIGKISNI